MDRASWGALVSRRLDRALGNLGPGARLGGDAVLTWILIGTPSARNPTWDYVACLIPTMFSVGSGPNTYVQHKVVRNALVTDARTLIVREALEKNASHIFWIDDDMIWPPDALASMLERQLPIIGANCTTRKLPIEVTAQKNHRPVVSYGRHGLEEVDAVGMAVMLTETEVFRKIPEPWFLTGYDPTDKGALSCTEDVYFCLLAREHGYKVMIDHDISRKVGHVGEMVYHHGMTQRHVEAAE